MSQDSSLEPGSRWDPLTRTRAGTPMGDLLRRYWWPIAGASELEKPGTLPVRLMGEDLVLYKDWAAMAPTPLTGRQVSPDYVRAIAKTGGSVGIWHFFPSLERYRRSQEMAEIVDVDSVSIGTDQFDSRGCLEDYTRWVHLVAAMLRGGFTTEEAGEIAGGNYMPIFRAAVGSLSRTPRPLGPERVSTILRTMDTRSCRRAPSR